MTCLIKKGAGTPALKHQIKNMLIGVLKERCVWGFLLANIDFNIPTYVVITV